VLVHVVNLVVLRRTAIVKTTGPSGEAQRYG
jgi:hypothetical protein